MLKYKNIVTLKEAFKRLVYKCLIFLARAGCT
jgi:hypothetical protein